MTTEEAVWLVDVFLPYWNQGLRGKTMPIWYEAERILRGKTEIEPRSCTCHWKGMAMEVKARYSQRQTEIETLYNDYQKALTTTTRKRRTKSS